MWRETLKQMNSEIINNLLLIFLYERKRLKIQNEHKKLSLVAKFFLMIWSSFVSQPIKPTAVKPSNTTMNNAANSILISSSNSSTSTVTNKPGLISSTPIKGSSQESAVSPVCPVTLAGNFAAVAATNPASKPATSTSSYVSKTQVKIVLLVVPDDFACSFECR